MKMMKRIILIVVCSLIVPKLNAECNRTASNEVRTSVGNKSIFNKLATLYNPVLNATLTQDSKQLLTNWTNIDSFLECLYKYYGTTVQRKYSLPLDQTLAALKTAHEVIRDTTESLLNPYDKGSLKALLNPLYDEGDAIYKILQGAMQALDKNTVIKTKKADPNAVFPGYEKFYKELISWAGSNIQDQRLLAFLQKKEIFSKDPFSQNASDKEQLKHSAKNFATKVQRLVQILQENMSLWGKISGIPKQIDTWKKVINKLEQQYRFKQEDVMSSILLEKLFVTDDDASFLLIGQATGLYDALKKLLVIVEGNIKKSKK